jgi:hypothetical protein
MNGRRWLSLITLAAAQALPCQAADELVFVGTSTSGSVDPHVLVESATGTVLVSANSTYTDNVTGAAWTDNGRSLYVAQGLMDRIAVAQWDGASPAWSTLFAAGEACYGVGIDHDRRRLWTLTGPTSSSRELVCIDIDLQSPTYGGQIGQTTGLSGALRERWSLSASGDLACVPKVLIGGSNSMLLVDLDPASPSYLQVITSTGIPGVPTSGFAAVAECRVSADDQFVYVLWAGTSSAAGLAVYDRIAHAWLDFDAAIGPQDFALPLSSPVKMDLAEDRTFAVLCGHGGAGWAARIDLDYAAPQNSAWTAYTQVAVPQADGVRLSPGGSRLAVTSTNISAGSGSELLVLDVLSGAVLAQAALSSMPNASTTAWQDASPTATYTLFGQGCPGSFGTPSLSVAFGDRPALGSIFVLDVGNLHSGLALMATGLSATVTSAGLPLPLDLAAIGMPGCQQLVDALVLDLMVSSATTASWSWAIPANPAIFGIEFFNQAFVPDPGANAFGFAVSNAGSGRLGF